MTTASRDRLKVTASLLAGSLVLAHILFLLLPNVFESWNAQAIDQLFWFRSRSSRLLPHYDNTIVHLDLNNTSIQDLQQFYFTRSHYARVIRNLAAMRVSAQVFDFIFAAPQSIDEDQALIEATSGAGNVYFGMAFTLAQDEQARGGVLENPAIEDYLSRTGWPVKVEGEVDGFPTGTNPLVTFPMLSGSSRGLGSLNINEDPDGVYRRFPLLIRYGNAFYPSLPFRVICDYLSVTPERIVLKPGRSITLLGARRPGGEPRNIEIPVDRMGNLGINFIGPWERMTHYNFSDVYRASDDREELETFTNELAGKIVVISDVSANSRDLGPVPTDTNFPLSGLLSDVMHNILTGSFLREVSSSQMFLVDLILLAFVLLFSVRLSPLYYSISVVALAVVYLGLVALSFLYFQVIFKIVRPLLMLSFAMTSNVAYRYIVEEREKSVLRKTFEAYFPASVVQKIMANPNKIASTERKELTVLFSDIVNFTRNSANMTPDRIQDLLNEYFEAMTEIVFRHEGTLDKFMGDGLMVFFGDPEPQEDHATRCVRMAIEMQHRIRELSTKWEKNGEMPLQVRIGINTGMVVVGNMGSGRRLSYTALGPAVNLAQRMEARAPIAGILITQRTRELLDGRIRTRPLGKIQVKGFEEPVEVHEVPVDHF